MFGSTRVVEDEYVYDIALRIQRIVRARGGLAFMTITDTMGERNWLPNRIFPDARTERFALDKTIVRAGTRGLNKRLAYGNLISRRYPKHRQVWMSIHFDVVGRSTDIAGIRIIAPDTELPIAVALGKTFATSRRLRADNPVVQNGDRDFGLRRLFVLTARNRIRNRVLIEMGNFNNPSDLWRIRDYRVRDLYVHGIVRALEIW
jgi:N-acetylmuramoyl-L-alanine amidase